MNFKIVYGGILIAIVIAVGGYVFPQVKQVAIELGSGTRFQHGISIGTATAPAANGMKIGDNGSEFTWVIDPLDGTTPYTAGLSTFAISIGLLKRFQPILGGDKHAGIRFDVLG